MVVCSGLCYKFKSLQIINNVNKFHLERNLVTTPKLDALWRELARNCTTIYLLFFFPKPQFRIIILLLSMWYKSHETSIILDWDFKMKKKCSNVSHGTIRCNVAFGCACLRLSNWRLNICLECTLALLKTIDKCLQLQTKSFFSKS